MRRSTVLSGLHTQRDRAKVRGRRDGCGGELADSAKEKLAAWLQSSIQVDDVSDIETFNLNDFLRDTGHINLTERC